MNIKDLHIDNSIDYDKQLDKVEGGDNVYQFQQEVNEQYCYLVKVGKTIKHSDVLIDSFDYKNKIKCNMISCLYNEQELCSLESNSLFPLVKLTCYLKKNKNKLSEQYTISYNAHIFEYLQKNIHVIDFTTVDKNDKIKIKCFYSYTIHKNNKMDYIEKIKYGNTSSKTMEKLIKYLMEYDTLELN